MAKIIHKKICRHCKVKIGQSKHQLIKHKNGDVIQEYTCRDCNRKKLKNWRDKNKDRVIAIVRKYELKNKEKRLCWNMVAKAIQKGELVKPKYCSVCKKNCNVEAHHEDYTKPLDVVWLCRKCHKVV